MSRRHTLTLSFWGFRFNVEVNGKSWSVHRNSIISWSKTLPTDPCFAYPKPPGPTVYGSEFLSFGGDFGDVWGMRLSGYVGFPLDLTSFRVFILLLMVQKSHSQPPGMMLKPWDSGSKLPTSTGEFTGFLHHPSWSMVSMVIVTSPVKNCKFCWCDKPFHHFFPVKMYKSWIL